MAGGRPKRVLTPEEIAQVEKLASVLNQEQLCDFLEIPSRTFRAILQRDEVVSAAYKKGAAKALTTVGYSLISSATRGNVAAQIFYLKTRGGWREAQPEAQELPPVVIQLTPDDSDEASE